MQGYGEKVLILGCARITGLNKDIEKAMKAPAINGLVCNLMIIESFFRYRVGFSKIAKYQ